jgi:hypothetical protein
MLLRWSRGPNLRKKEDRPASISAHDVSDDALFAQVQELRDERKAALDANAYRRLLSKFGRDKMQKHLLVVLAQKEHDPRSFRRSEVAAYIDRLKNDHAEPDWYQDLKRAERLSPFDGSQPNQTSLDMYGTFFRD